MNRFWDVLPRAIRFKWKTTIQPTLGRFRRTTDQQADVNDDSFLSPTIINKPQQFKEQKTNILANVPELLDNCPYKPRWRSDTNFYRWPFSLSRTFGLIGTGAILAFVLKFNKIQWNLKNNTNKSESSWLECIAYALPLNKASIFDLDQKPSHDSSSSEHKADKFSGQDSETEECASPEVLINKIATMCVGIEESIEGIKAANNGDLKSAVEHWQKSSDVGHSKSNFNLGLCYETGRGVTKNLKKAMMYYQMAADEEHCQAMYNLALLHLNLQNTKKNSHLIIAINLLERAADLGLPQAQTQLGVFYANGDQNFSKAFEMFTAAAQQEDMEAVYYLGLCFDGGFGVDENKSKAVEFFTKASNTGHSDAQYYLADYYEHGLGGLPKNEILAQELYQKSAKAGNKNSQKKLQEIFNLSSIDESDQKSTESDNRVSQDPQEISGDLECVLDEPSWNWMEKATQLLSFVPNPLTSLLDYSQNALSSLTNNGRWNPRQEENLYLEGESADSIEERYNYHVQYMPHCSTRRNVPLSNLPEVVCS